MLTPPSATFVTALVALFLARPAPPLVEASAVAPGGPPASLRGDRPSGGEILIGTGELAALETSGTAWRALVEASTEDTSAPDLSDQDDPTNVRVLAKALVAQRTDDESLREEVRDALRALPGTQAGGRTLALGRELAAYVLAADLVGLRGADARDFEDFLTDVRHEVLDGRTLISTHRDRPNNWGGHAGASRIAVALYLGDRRELEDAANVLRGYLGDRSAYSGFRYRELSWQANPGRPVGINPMGAALGGHSVDGVLPDDQRRAGRFSWPPPTTNYAWEALQGLLLQALLLERAGYDVWQWSDRALMRAARWLVFDASFPPEGDDLWQLAVLERAYPDPGFDWPEVPPSAGSPRPGKGFGFTDFLYPTR